MPCRAEDREDEDREEAKYAVNIVGGPGGKNFSRVRACQRPGPPFASRCQVQLFPCFLIGWREWVGRVLMVSPVPPAPVPVVSSESRWPAILRILGLVGVISLLWCKHYGMWTLDAWRVPLDYSGDSFEILTRIKAASEGDTWPLMPQVIHRLGAPWGAHWNAYPTPDKFLIIALGGLSRLVGLEMAANLAMLLATVSSGVACYFVARRFGARIEWAMMAAVLFAYTYSVFDRGLAHLLLLFTWTVPLGLLACWLVGRREPLRWRSMGAWGCLAIGASLGVSNPYNLFFWGQLFVLAMVAQFFRTRHWVNLQVGAATMGMAAVGFFIVHAEFWLHTKAGGVPLLVRNYAGTEVYALKMVEMFVPPTGHRWDWMAFFGYRYARWTNWRGEVVIPYLGIVGMLGFIWLWIDAARRVLRGRSPSGWSLQAGWVLAYGTMGGITNVLALYLGFNLFRATNRISVFISCIVLLFVVQKLTLLTSRLRPVWSYALAGVITLLGAMDQIPKAYSRERRAEQARVVKADAEFGRKLEAALPPGSLVFQLPVLGFPEVNPPHLLSDYELFRPYLHTSTLCFSYGGTKLRSRTRWQRDLQSLPVSELVPRLERYGFAAIYLNRRGYKDEGESVIKALRELGYPKMIEGEYSQVAVVLNAVADPELPLGTILTPGEGWYSRVESQSGVDVRWAHGPSALMYFNPMDRPLPVNVELTLVGAGDRTVEVSFRGKILTEARIGETPVVLPPVPIELHPGINRIDVRTEEPTVRMIRKQYGLRSVGLVKSKVTPRLTSVQRIKPISEGKNGSRTSSTSTPHRQE